MNQVQAITTTPPPSGAASSMAASPDWIHTYFRELAHHTEKARAAQAAGQTLPEIARRRLHDPAFAEEEAILLEAFADYLESEAIRRCCDRSYTESCKKPLGSDTLLIRLLNLFHPKFTGLRAIQQSLSRSTQSTNHRRSTARPPLPDEEGRFKTRTDLVAFREWERHQAIALALDLLMQPPAAAPSSSLSCSCSCSPEAAEPTSASTSAIETPRSGDRQVTAISTTSSKAALLTANPESTCSSPSREILFNPESRADARQTAEGSPKGEAGGRINPVNPVKKEHLSSAVTASAFSQSIPPTESTADHPAHTTYSIPQSPEALWAAIESVIATHRAEIKRLRGKGYSKNSQAISIREAEIAKGEAYLANLRPHLPENFLSTITPDPDPPP